MPGLFRDPVDLVADLRLPVERGNLLPRQTNQGIAVLERMVDEREGVIPSQCHEPERELRQAHRERVLVHAV